MNLKEFREKYIYTQKELADLTKIDQSLICYYESGMRSPKRPNVKRLRTALEFISGLTLSEDDVEDIINGKYK